MGFLDLFRNDRGFTPTAVLPTEGWSAAPGLGRLNLVWPWYSVDTPSALVDEYDRPTVTPAIELRAPRTDGEVALVMWAETGGGFLVGPTWGPSVARSYSATSEWDAPMMLGGLPGRIVQMRTPHDVAWRLIVPREHDCVHAELRVPVSTADGYWPQVQTMLATWTWDG